jgi:predicted metal-binding membrane protein
MMAAMMLPAIIPFTIGLDRLLGAHPKRRRRLAALTTGYLAVWGLAGVLALLVVDGFDALAAGPTTINVRVGGVVLLAAGAYQFTPLKRWCLLRCRSPLALVMQHGQRARSAQGALHTGLIHGGYCLGCCWALMLVLLAAGVMSLVWMAAIAALITVEKVLPRGEDLAYAIGALLLALGALLITAPGVLATSGLIPGSEAAP